MSRSLAIDTNIYTALINGEADVVKVLLEARFIIVPLPVLAEVYAGLSNGTRWKEGEAALQEVLSHRGVATTQYINEDGESRQRRARFEDASRARETSATGC